MKSKDIFVQEDHDDRLNGYLELYDDDVETSPQPPPPLPPLDDSVGPVGLGGPHLHHHHHHNPCINIDEDDEDENILTGIQGKTYSKHSAML